MSIGSGNLRVGELRVGTTGTGSAQGTLTIGGTIAGNGTGDLLAGISSAASGSVVNAVGTIEATGLAGFTSYHVGSLIGTVGVGSQAQGRVAASGVATTSSTGNVNVGTLLDTVNRSTASGELALDDATLELTGGALQAGRIVQSGRGSAATGKVTIGGSAGTA